MVLSIVTAGFGTFGSIAKVVTMGFFTGEEIVFVPTIMIIT